MKRIGIMGGLGSLLLAIVAVSVWRVDGQVMNNEVHFGCPLPPGLQEQVRHGSPPPPAMTGPATPPVSVPPAPSEKTVYSLLKKLADLQAKKAQIESEVKETVDSLQKEMVELKQQYQKLGVNTEVPETAPPPLADEKIPLPIKGPLDPLLANPGFGLTR